MNLQNNGPKAPGPIRLRRAARPEARQVAELIVRMKKLNNEFDPLFEVVAGAKQKAEKYIGESLKSKSCLVLVAADADKVVGVLRGEMRERQFYEPSREGFITDFYILPEYRRKALGNRILKAASAELKRMGAQIIVAEVPSQNEIAVRFYTKRGFRPLVQFFGRSH